MERCEANARGDGPPRCRATATHVLHGAFGMRALRLCDDHHAAAQAHLAAL